MMTSYTARRSLAVVATLALTASAAAQRLEIHAAAGPTWRGAADGRHRSGFDAMTFEGSVTRRVADRFKLRAALGVTVGSASVAIATGAPCDPSGFCPGGGRLGTLIPGTTYRGRAGIAWVVPGTADRLEARAGAGVHAASVSGPDAVLGIDAGISAAIVPWLHIGVDATRFTSDLGVLRWIVTPTIRLRLRSGGR